MLTADEAWGEVQREFARIDATPGPRKRRRKSAEEEAAEFERVPDPPDLTFEFAEAPPRWTAQSNRGVRVVKGRPMLYTKAKARAGAAKLEAMFRGALPAGWVPRGGACRVEVQLVYGLRKGERVPSAEVLIPHTEKPDLTNVWKSPEDALKRALVGAGAVFDDSQIYDLHLRKFRGLVPRWEVRMWWEQGPAQTQFDF